MSAYLAIDVGTDRLGRRRRRRRRRGRRARPGRHAAARRVAGAAPPRAPGRRRPSRRRRPARGVRGQLRGSDRPRPAARCRRCTCRCGRASSCASGSSELTGLPTVLGPAAPGPRARRALDGAAATSTTSWSLLVSDAVEAGVHRATAGCCAGGSATPGRSATSSSSRTGCRACAAAGCLTAYVSSSAIEAETNRPLRRAPASVIERTGMMIGRAVASAVAVFDLRLVLLAGRRAGGVRRTRCSTPPVASSTSAAASPTSGPAPTAASTASASSCPTLGRVAPLDRRRRRSARWRAGAAWRRLAAPGSMNPTYGPEAEAYREKVQAFLAEKLPADWAGHRRARGRRGRASSSPWWRTTLYEAGYLAPGWPVEYGGGGLSRARAGDPRRGVRPGRRADRRAATTCSASRCSATRCCMWGTEEQKQHYLPRILSGEDTLVPGLLRAQRRLRPRQPRRCGPTLDGDQWVLNGQKIWTSAGHLADHIFTLARTDPDAPKHKGISFLLVDMRQPGIEVRPIKMISGRERVQRGLLHRRRVPRRTRSSAASTTAGRWR